MVEPVGRCGGLAIFWKKSSNITFNFVNKNLMNFCVLWKILKFFLSCVYGNLNSQKRNQVWERLNIIGIQIKLPWAMLGDFKEIFNNSKKLGGPQRSDSLFVEFNEMMRICGKKDLLSWGNNFSWNVWRNKKMDLV